MAICSSWSPTASLNIFCGSRCCMFLIGIILKMLFPIYLQAVPFVKNDIFVAIFVHGIPDFNHVSHTFSTKTSTDTFPSSVWSTTLRTRKEFIFQFFWSRWPHLISRKYKQGFLLCNSDSLISTPRTAIVAVHDALSKLNFSKTWELRVKGLKNGTQMIVSVGRTDDSCPVCLS